MSLFFFFCCCCSLFFFYIFLEYKKPYNIFASNILYRRGKLWRKILKYNSNKVVKTFLLFFFVCARIFSFLFVCLFGYCLVFTRIKDPFMLKVKKVEIYIIKHIQGTLIPNKCFIISTEEKSTAFLCKHFESFSNQTENKKIENIVFLFAFFYASINFPVQSQKKTKAKGKQRRMKKEKLKENKKNFQILVWIKISLVAELNRHE